VSASTTTHSGQTGRSGFAGRFTALRECLQKAGITLPKRKPGKPGAGGGPFGGGAGPTLPKGVTRAQYLAAIQKCGGGAFVGGGSRIQSPAFKQSLVKFASCMRENGVNLPAPNTSGKGPIFDTKGVSTASPQFRTADAKCSTDLRGTFRRGPGTGGPPSGGGAPPGGGSPDEPQGGGGENPGASGGPSAGSSGNSGGEAPFTAG
jgi:hypothetical protein